MQKIMVAMDNSNGEEGSFLLLTSFGHGLHDLLVKRGEG